ncbi:MAG: FAD-binding oxidoreductase [Chloroflexota bacterium]
MKTNIAIIGGGVIGSFIAYFLQQSGRADDIVVIEPDASYELAATTKGAGGVRQLFSLPENIEMSRFSVDFYRHFAERLEMPEATIDWEQRGYLFVVGESGAKQLETNANTQAAKGAVVELLQPSELKSRFPSLGIADVALACLSPEDGTLTTTAVLTHLRHKNESLNIPYLDSHVTRFSQTANQITAAHLANGETIFADVFINAAGAWCSDIANMVGMALPVEPMCRVKHFWTVPQPIEPLPLVKDESGMFFRPQANGFGKAVGFVGGRPSFEIPAGFYQQNQTVQDYFSGYFKRTVQPLISRRLPAFANAEEQTSWIGHYAQNRLDGNMILGAWTTGAPNFYVACGFSGHGIMHAPAVGRAMAELVMDGRFSTIDLSRLSYERVVEERPLPEQGII